MNLSLIGECEYFPSTVNWETHRARFSAGVMTRDLHRLQKTQATLPSGIQIKRTQARASGLEEENGDKHANSISSLFSPDTQR
jgi:hypothetical protein